MKDGFEPDVEHGNHMFSDVLPAEEQRESNMAEFKRIRNGALQSPPSLLLLPTCAAPLCRCCS